jgi:hypothetical protein
MHSKTSSLAITLLTGALILALPASSALASQGRGHGQAKKAEKTEKADKQDKAEKRDTDGPVVIDRDGHVRAIHEYARGGSLPPGLAKREALPPGLQKQLRENGSLPPGLEKRWVAVPPPLAARLPPVPPYYHRYFAGDDLLVVDSRTNRIIAIVRDVWR